MRHTHGSFLAVYEDGKHLSFSRLYTSHAAFRTDVRLFLGTTAKDVSRFFFAYGAESHEYTRGELLSEFFGEL